MSAWSQTRLLITLAVAALIVMEPVSWMTASIPPCIVNPENYGAYYADHNACPTFHVFLIKLLARVFEHFGDPSWVVADFTVVLALSTICLWVVTWRDGVRQSHDMQESINAATRAANVAERALVELERPFVYIEINEPGLFASGVTTSQPHYRPSARLNCLCVNHGRTPADMWDLKERVVLIDEGQFPDPLLRERAVKRTLPPGCVSSTTKPWTFSVNLMERIRFDEWNLEEDFLSKRLYFLGYVRYLDIFGNRYITGFCAIFDPIRGRFILRGDERYNYAYMEQKAPDNSPD